MVPGGDDEAAMADDPPSVKFHGRCTDGTYEEASNSDAANAKSHRNSSDGVYENAALADPACRVKFYYPY